MPTLTQLETAAVSQSYEQQAQMLAETFPSLDTRRGVFGDIVLYANAILAADRIAQLETLRRSLSLSLLAEDPDGADPAVVDMVLANWGVSRGTSLPSQGNIVIVLRQKTALTVPSGAVFVSGGQRYRTTQTFVARTAQENVSSDNDRLLVQIAADRWAFTVEAVAETAGTAGQVKKDAQFVPLSPPTSFVRAYAEDDFTGAVDALTTPQMLDQLQLGIAAKAYSNRVTTEAMIKQQEGHEAITAVSIIGAGDVELLRSKSSVLPLALPGGTDVYIRSRSVPQLVTLRKTATYVGTTDCCGEWQFVLAADDFPGFYDVVQVRQTDGTVASNRMPSDVRGIDVINNGYVPDMPTPRDGAYTAYQTAVINFIDPDTPHTSLVSNVSTREYDVVVRGLPLVDSVQEQLNAREVRNPAGDHVVRAAIPCFVSVSLAVAGASPENVDAIKNAVAGYVNSTAFVSAIYASKIGEAVHAVLSAAATVSNVDITGRLRTPGGEWVVFRSRDVLEVPECAEQDVTSRTVCFFLDPQDVRVTLV
jgi:uncharacterized phage protein gp47/JayE